MEVQKAWKARTFVHFGQKNLSKTVAWGRGRWGDATACAGVGFGAVGAGGFLRMKAAGSCKTVAGAYFRGRGACTQYDPEVILCAQTLDPEGDAYYGSSRNQILETRK